MANKHIYDTDEKKITFFISFLKEGTAGPWAEAEMTKAFTNDQGFGTWEAFTTRFLNAFTEADTAGDARAKLRVLRQTATADEYIAEFRMLTARCGITEDVSLIEYFQEGLQNKLVEKVYGMEHMPKTIDEWYEATSRFDNQYRRARAVINRYKGVGQTRNLVTPRYTPPTKDPNAMDVDRLSTSKREKYMKEGRCFTCGQTGHRAADHKQDKGRQPDRRPVRTAEVKEDSDKEVSNIAKIKAMMAELEENDKIKLLEDMAEKDFA
ncbi:hypothetical protein GLOTRDRAFT_134605 [Gloeophyllum trabeum ATCC 11539]|uniref:CCHC-type domain-containing protein n=1 Tax=Gloeophyllum trabeum (strain ATCC 11539 / FP-39264 / Madison 617) TaxID=670483 RepID=S7R5Y1_GLOTA|nr:uncharacterized protein GLOTRDRAFT_134605 [Gloeophyllum trabeum ATCC 11539]EPQ49790.1 hypothetical protein GLOTRDRAFT_134605 [Gloeophyllum trabeum ATCC 11539]